MSLSEIIEAKQYIGQEFLTWLWYLSEEEEHISLSGDQVVTIMMGDTMVLGPAMGMDGTRVSIKGREFTLAEAREGLRRGKLLESLRFGLAMEEGDFWLTLKAADLSFSSLKLPPTGGGEEPQEKDAILLERVALVNTAINAVEELFKRFLEGRLASESGGGLWASLKEWAHGEKVPGYTEI